MILSPDYLKQLKTNQLKNHVHKLVKIQKAHFGLSTQAKVLAKYKSNKNF